MMLVSVKIQKAIEALPKGEVFDYARLGIDKANYLSAAKALERLQKKQVIKKISKGIFYNPQQSVFGELGPDTNSILQQILFKNNKRVAYITGYSLYNQMNLTTQNSFVYEIASYSRKTYPKMGTLKIKPVRSYVPVNDTNFELLGLLDAIKDINRIPDTPKELLIQMFITKLKKLGENESGQLIELALQYPPRVRALLGSLIELSGIIINVEPLQKGLNPLSLYKLNFTESSLPNRKNWNIE